MRQLPLLTCANVNLSSATSHRSARTFNLPTQINCIRLQLFLSLTVHQPTIIEMKVEIIDTELKLNIIGFGGIAVNKDYAGTAFKLMDKMWSIVKADGIKHKGM